MERKISTLSILFCTVMLSSCWTDLCPDSDFVVANITEKDMIVCVDWVDVDDILIKSISKIDSNSVINTDVDVDICSIKHAFACDYNLNPIWKEMDEESRKKWCKKLKMDEESRKKWCKKLKCVDCKSKSCWNDYNPMKYNGTACVCDY
jgi:hypothetical protein